MQETDSSKELLLVEGNVDRIVYADPETQFGVVVIVGPGRGAETVLVGNLFGIQPGEYIRCQGRYELDPRYGKRFRVDHYESVLPSNVAAIEKFLSSGLIRGIGKTYAKRLVERFGENVFDIIENEPQRLREVDGIGPKRIDQIIRSWEQHRAVRDLMLFLQQYGIPQSFAPRLLAEYGSDTIEQIRRNPYQLALDIKGIGFKRADALAERLGIPRESIERVKAGVYYLLHEMAEDGHCFYPADPLIEQASTILEVGHDLVVSAINALQSEKRVVLEILPDETRAVYLTPLYRHEVGVTQLLTRLIRTPKLFPKLDAEAELERFEQRYRFTLATQQRHAVAMALKGGVMVVTGGPGTGKTTIIRTILTILQGAGIRVHLAAPTGRASKRMQELTGYDASTIHRLLQYSPQEGRFLRNPQNPLRTDFLIVDETSMLDITMAYHLLRALPATASLIFVGDVDQLPSVGPGNFLRDLILSETIPTVALHEVYRQAQESMIITNAHRINQGKMPVLPRQTDKTDFLFVQAEAPDQVLEEIKRLAVVDLPKRMGFSPTREIQVITPMHRGLIGAQNLNRELQQVLNPNSPGIERGGMTFKVGDKVMQTANDYDKDVFNGDIGFITNIDREEQLLKVRFDQRVVVYDFSELDQLELAYAITVHKSQGSEYPAVIMPVHTTHALMLQRNLLYTAITRGKRLVCLVGQAKAIALAVHNVNQTPRYSGLHLRLRNVLQNREDAT